MLSAEFLSSGIWFRKQPNLNFIGWGTFIWKDRHDENKPSFYCPDFYLENQTPWLVPEHFAIISDDQFLRFLSASCSPSPPSFSSLKWNEPSFEDFQNQFQLAMNLIQTKSIKKIVPLVHQSCLFHLNTKHIRFFLIRNLLSAGDHFSYGFWSNDSGLMGQSPELLFSMFDSKLKTMALAGTHDKSKITQFKSNPKEKREHQLVIDDLINQLNPFGEIKKNKTTVLPYHQLIHFKTLLEVQLKIKIEFETLVRLLHPTPALGVFPRTLFWKDLMKLIDNKQQRWRYGAPFGIRLNSHEFHCLVGIRNIQWHNNQIHLSSGCGIVEESLLEKEWNELKNKRQTVKNVFFNDGLLNIKKLDCKPNEVESST